jgi:hypothetical protein
VYEQDFITTNDLTGVAWTAYWQTQQSAGGTFVSSDERFADANLTPVVKSVRYISLITGDNDWKLIFEMLFTTRVRRERKSESGSFSGSGSVLEVVDMGAQGEPTAYPTGATACSSDASLLCCMAGYGAATVDGAAACTACTAGKYQDTETSQAALGGCKAQPECAKDHTPPTFYFTRVMSTTEKATNNCVAMSSCNQVGKIIALSNEQAVGYATSDADVTCGNAVTLCTASQYWVDRSASAFTNMEWHTQPTCADLTDCTSDQYWSNSAASSIFVTIANVLQNMYSEQRNCMERTVCSIETEFFVNHAVIADEPVSNSQVNNDCNTLVACAPGAEYQSSAPTTTTDRECKALAAECISNVQFQSVAPTATRNRYCSDVQTCSATSQYQTVVPTTTSDRGCGLATECNADTEYEDTPLQGESDRACEPLTVCSETQLESVTASAKTNRECVDVTTSPTTTDFDVTVDKGEAVDYSESGSGSESGSASSSTSESGSGSEVEVTQPIAPTSTTATTTTAVANFRIDVVLESLARLTDTNLVVQQHFRETVAALTFHATDLAAADILSIKLTDHLAGRRRGAATGFQILASITLHHVSTAWFHVCSDCFLAMVWHWVGSYSSVAAVLFTVPT